MIFKRLSVQEKDFDPSAEVKAMTTGRPDIGAVCQFTGLMRGDRDTVAMTLEHYPGMTEKQLRTLMDDACARWPLTGCCLIHRYGRLIPGDQIVLVITTSPHRDAAFDSCHFLMDWLKTQAPFWKCEETSQGDKKWVESRDTDTAAARHWDTQDGKRATRRLLGSR